MIYVPWLLALITAGCFTLMAWRTARNLFPWALTGAIVALVTATIVLGLGQATDNPFSDEQLKSLQVRWVIEAVLAIVVLSWFFTLPLHQHHLVLWRALFSKPIPPAPSAPAVEAKPKPEAPKQPGKPQSSAQK